MRDGRRDRAPQVPRPAVAPRWPPVASSSAAAQISCGIGRRGARKYRSGEYGAKLDTRDVYRSA